MDRVPQSVPSAEGGVPPGAELWVSWGTEAGSSEGQVANAGESWWNQEQKAWGPGPCPQPGLHPGRWGQAYWRSMRQAGQVSFWEGLEVLFGTGVGSHSLGGFWSQHL